MKTLLSKFVCPFTVVRSSALSSSACQSCSAGLQPLISISYSKFQIPLTPPLHLRKRGTPNYKLDWNNRCVVSQKRGNSYCRASRTTWATTTAVESENTVSLPLDYYQILGVDRQSLPDHIRQAFEGLASNPPRYGYSIETLSTRQEILRAAYNTLEDSKNRREYDAELDGLESDPGGTPVIPVPASKVPAVLCLLQEAGEASTVAEAGEMLLLPEWQHLDPVNALNFRRDLALATALAFWDQAQDLMSADAVSLTTACELLERAIKLLQEETRWGGELGASLQEAMQEALTQIEPVLILELLAQPLEDSHTVFRIEALKGVRSLLWAKSGEKELLEGVERERFMEQAFARMTASEIVDFYSETPRTIDADVSEIYTIAQAYISRGFWQHRPADIQEADKLLFELQSHPGLLQSSQTDDFLGAAGLPLEVSLDRGMCALLLGEVDLCKKWLGLHTGLPQGDLGVARFVYGNSPRAQRALESAWWQDPVNNQAPLLEEEAQKGTEDSSMEEDEGDLLLPGLCRLAESWLGEVVFARFREVAGQQAVLSYYFDSPAVVRYLENLHQGSPLARLYALGEGVQTLTAQTLGALFNSRKQKALDFPTRQSHMDQREMSTDASATSAVARSRMDLLGEGQGESLRELGAAPEQIESGQVSSSSPDQRGAVSDQTYVGDHLGGSQGGGEAGKGRKHSGAAGKGIMAVTVLAAAAAISVALVRQMKLWPWPGAQGPGAPLAPQRQAAHTSAYVKLKEAAPPARQLAAKESELEEGMEDVDDTAWVESLLKQWQEIKAQACGNEHSLKNLDNVLAGPMLKLWKGHAEDVKLNGWSWHFMLLGLKIGKVQLARDGQMAQVQATLQEAATVRSEHHPESSNSYRGSYDVRYLLRKVGGSWKLWDSTILR